MANPLALLRRKRIWIPLALVAVYGLLGFLVAPGIVRDQIVSGFRRQFGREARLARVRINPFILSLTLEGFELRDPDGTPFVQFDRLYLDFQLSSLVRWALTFREFSLSNPRVHVRLMPGGRANFADLVPRGAGKPPRLVIGRLSLRHGSIHLTNLMAPEPEEGRLEPLDLDLRDFTTIPDHRGLYRIAATDQGGGGWQWTGGLMAEPPHAAGTLEISGSRLRPLWEIVKKRVPFEITDGRFACRLNYEVDVQGDTVQARLKDTSFSITALALRERGTDPELLRMDSLTVRGIEVRYPEQTATVARVLVAGTRASVWLNRDRTLNWLSMLAPTGAGGTRARGSAARQAPAASAAPGPAPTPGSTSQRPPASAAAAASWSVALSEFAIRDLGVAFEDRTVRPPFAVSVAPVNLTVRNISSRPGARFDVETDATIAGKGRFECAGTVTATPPTADLKLRLADLPLDMFQTYLNPLAKLRLVGGTLGISGNVTLRDQKPIPDVRFVGRVESKEFLTRDRIDNERFLTWKALDVEGVECTPARVRIGTVRFTQPYAKFIVHRDHTTNVQDILRMTPLPSDSAEIASESAEPDTGSAPVATGPAAMPSAAPAPRASAAPAGKVAAAGRPAGPGAKRPATLPVRIGTVEVRNGSADFADLSLILPFAARIEGLSGKITGLSSDSASRATVEVGGSLQPSGTAQVRGEINPLAASPSLNLNVVFHGFSMPALTPYTGQFLGRKVEKGKMSLDLQYQLEGKHLVGQNKIVLDQLELGNKIDSPEATKLPVGLAIAILKDGDGKIDLDVPVEGNVDDPKFRIGRVIMQFLKSLLAKVATAPFALLGALFGGHADELSHVDFALGTSEIATDQQAALGKLAQALGKRPQLRLEVRGRADADSDAAALRRSKFALLAAEKIEANPKKYGGGLGYSERLLEDLYAERFGEKGLRDLRERHKVAAGELAVGQPQYKAGSKKLVVDPTAMAAAIQDTLTSLQTVGTTELQSLANARGGAIKQSLVQQGVNESRVYVVEPEPGKVKDGLIRIDLTLTD